MRFLAALLWLALLAGCASQYRPFSAPPLDFSDRNPLYLRVDDVPVVDETTPAGQPPEVAHTLPITPQAAVRELLQYRLRPAGGTGVVRAVIQEASVEEQPLPTTPGLPGYLTTEPSAQLVGRLKLRLERLDEMGNVVSSISTAVRNTRAIPEDAAFVTRQEIGYDLVRELVNDLDTGLVSNLRESFASLLTTAPQPGAPRSRPQITTSPITAPPAAAAPVTAPPAWNAPVTAPPATGAPTPLAPIRTAP